MKRILAVILALIVWLCIVASSYAIDSIDLKRLSIEELQRLQQNIAEIIVLKREEERSEPNITIEGRTLREIFPDVELAKIVRDEIPKVSIDDIVTQIELDRVTSIVSHSSNIASLDGIGNLRKLETLCLWVNAFMISGGKHLFSDDKIMLEILPDEIGDLSELRTLVIEGFKFTIIPNSILNLTNLKRLEIVHGPLLCIPDAVGTLVNLEEVRFAGTEITEIPTSLCCLPLLKKLDLSGSEIVELPEIIGNLSMLKSLDLSHSQIGKLPESIGYIQTLRTLNISYTKISSLPASIYNLQLDSFDRKGTNIE